MEMCELFMNFFGKNATIHLIHTKAATSSI